MAADSESYIAPFQLCTPFSEGVSINNNLRERERETFEMAHRPLKALAGKSHILSSIPAIHVKVEEEN